MKASFLRLALVAGCISTAIPGSAWSQEGAPADVTATADELSALRQGLGADTAPAQENPVQAASGTSMNPQMSLIFDGAAAWFRGPPGGVGGHDPSHSGFNLQALEMHLHSDVDPYLRLDAALAFGADGVEIEEVFATTLALAANLQARAGQFLSPIGRLNAMHPHSWQFLDKPLVLGKFLGADGSRGLGTELAWLTPLPWFAELRAVAMDAGSGRCCARSYLGDQTAGIDARDLLYTLAFKQFFDITADWSLLWGLSAQTGPNGAAPTARTAIYGTDIYLKYRPIADTQRAAVALQAEWLLRERWLPGRTLSDHGAYAQLVWNVDPNWELGARAEYATGLRDDALDPAWTTVRTRQALQVTWYPSHFSRLRLQAGQDRRPWLSPESGWSVMLGLEALIGAHGAHTY